MHHVNPRIYELKYPTGTPYWLVKCQVPDPSPENPFRKKSYQLKHSTAADAEIDKTRLIREHGGGGSVSSGELKNFELGQHRLATCQGDARGQSILTAIEWFIANFVDSKKTPFVEDAVALFEKEHVVRLRGKSRDEYHHYLPRLVARFGKCRIGELTTKTLQAYVDSQPAKLHHRKCLVGFFTFCAGGSRKIKSQYNWLDKNPAKHVSIPQDDVDSEIVILTLDEVQNCLALALVLGDLPYWVWALFTGMRPEEIKRFWTWEGYGWNRINFGAGTITVNSEIAKDKRRRKIIIRPVLREWLKYFRATGEPMFPTCHRLKFRSIKKETLPDEKFKINDLLRHTNISYRVQWFDKSLGTTAAESGNSEQIIKDHYLDLITDESKIEAFWNLTPKAFGLRMPKKVPTSSPPQDPS